MRVPRAFGVLLMGLAGVSGTAAGVDTATLYTACSLRNALTELAAAYTEAYGAEGATTF